MPENGNIVQMAGKRFGDLVVLRREGRIGKLAAWRCRCSCGNEVVVSGAKLRAGSNKSCTIGHKFRSTMVGVSRAEKTSWNQMLDRCYNPKNIGWENYGGRGIRVCRRWRLSFEAFLSDMGPRPSAKHSLDRYPDNDGDYELGNCRWATKKEQCRNTRRTVRVEVGKNLIVLRDYTNKLGISNKMVRRRLQRGWTIEEAISIPSRTRREIDAWPAEWLVGTPWEKKT